MGSDARASLVAKSAWPKLCQTPAAGEDGSLSIGEIAREYGVSLRALRFYQAKGLLAPRRYGRARRFNTADCERLALILQGKRLCFTLTEVHAMLAAWHPGNCTLPSSRKQCVEQISLLERQRRDLDRAIAELRRIYSGMFTSAARPTETA
jgi:DNA-binding transcriptional MerR regulator